MGEDGAGGMGGGEQKQRPSGGSKQQPKAGAGIEYSENPATKAKQLEIERKLADNKGKSAEEKKKMLRELQLEYHPDKNDDPLAKTVFQFVQGSKPWFMQDQ